MTGLKTTSLLKRFRTASAGVCAALAVSVASFSASVAAQEPAVGWPEKEELKFGFIKLTDMAPLAVAYEKGFLKMRASTLHWKRKLTGKCCLIA